MTAIDDVSRRINEEGEKEKESKVPARQILYDLAFVHIKKVFRDQTNEVYTVWESDGKTEIVSVESSDFDAILRRLYENDSNRIQDMMNHIDTLQTEYDKRANSGEAAQTLQDLKEEIIEAKKIARGIRKHDKVITIPELRNAKQQIISLCSETRYLANRVFWDRENNILYYNLGNKQGQIVEIKADPEGKSWKLANNSELLIFKSLGEKKEQILPSKDYDADFRYLRELSTRTNFKFEHQRFIDEIYTVSLFIPESHPVYLPNGPEGSGKSFNMILKKSLVDPHELRDGGTYEDRVSIALLNLETDERKSWDRALVIEQNWLSYFDNVSYINTHIMDEFCRWVEPGYYGAKEKKYLNKELSEIGGKRPIGLNGINNPITAPDLLSRIFAPSLDTLNEKEDDEAEDVLSHFFETKPKILGYIFSVLSKFLFHYPEMKKSIKSTKKHCRSFEIAGEVISRCLGNKEGAFQDAWNQNSEDQTDVAIEASTLAKVIMVYVQQSNKEIIELQPEELYRELRSLAQGLGYNLETDNSFPGASNILSRQINRLKATLAKKEIEVIIGEKNSSGHRVIKLKNRRFASNGELASSLTYMKDSRTFKFIVCDLARGGPFDVETAINQLVSSGKFALSEAEQAVEQAIKNGLLTQIGNGFAPTTRLHDVHDL